MKKRNGFVFGLLLITIIVGFLGCESIRHHFIEPVPRATLWVNGESQMLSNNASRANSVFVIDTNVYVAGWENERATLWVNGIPQTLSDTDSVANSVYVFGNDVYVAGSVTGRATLWINGVPQTLSNNNSRANSLFISEANIYVAGMENNRPMLWLNGVIQNQTLANVESTVHDIHVSGRDVYMVGQIRGYEGSHAAGLILASLWLNGESQHLAGVGSLAGVIPSVASSVYVSNSDVYVAGRAMDVRNRIYWATLWVNGRRQTLSNNTKQFGVIIVNSSASSVFVSGNDVYVVGVGEHLVGMQAVGTNRALLWVNDEPQTLSNSRSSASSVFVSGNDVYVAGVIER
jgi:hypothetical protein